MSRKLKGLTVFLGVMLLVSYAMPAFAEITFKTGVAERLRYEYYKDAADLNKDVLDNKSYFRIRTSVWGNLVLDPNISLYTRLTNENRAYTYYPTTNGKDYGYDINEVVFDNLYLDLKNVDVMGSMWDFRLGRQDLIGQYGEMFLISDWSVADGSRTAYFDALKGTLKVNAKNTVDVIGMHLKHHDDILPIINKLDGEQALDSGDTTGFVLYHKSDSFDNLHLENYYIYTNSKQLSTKATSSAKINTFGTFGKYKVDNSVTLRGQAAVQTGDYGQYDQEGFGGYLYADKSFKDAMFSPVATLGYFYLSGDDKGTNDYEGFSPVLSKSVFISGYFGDFYPAHLGGDTGSFFNSNMHGVGSKLALATTKNSKLTLSYYFLMADENQVASSLFSGSGKTRGHMPGVKLDYTFNKYASGYMLLEYFDPGSYYVGSADPGLFFRTELNIKF